MTKRRQTSRPAPSYETPPQHPPLPPEIEAAPPQSGFDSPTQAAPLQASPAPIAPSAMSRPQPRPKIHEADRIGDILRRVREHRGEDIESISDYLRIRPSFLVALENSHYEELPADAYVIGFLRTYALYLGLDGRGAIDQYRREMAGRRRKPQLSMPQPMSEGKTPTVAVLIAAALAGLLIYGLWYGLSTPDREIVEKPVPLPSIASTVAEPASVDANASSMQTTPTQETAPGQVAPMQVAPVQVAADQTPSPESTPANANNLPNPATVPAQAAQPPAGIPAAAATPPAAPNPAPPAAQKPAQPMPPTETKPATESAKPSATPAADAAEKPKEEPKPEKFGASDKSRVTVRAEKESWVLITDSKGLTVFDRTLKPGESYNVPDGKGYNLTTGNVAGVTLTIDGKTQGKLPANGRVARNVSLEPDKLKARLSGKKAPAVNDSGDDPNIDAGKSAGITVE